MRKDYLDVAKGLGILLVVLGHSLELYLGDGSGGTTGTGYGPALFVVWKFIYSFHMPLFFLLSGMATPRLAVTKFEKTVSGALYLIVVATTLQLLFAPLRLALPLASDTMPISVGGVLRAIVWPAIKLETYALIVIWFLPCLALVRVVVWLVANGRRPALTICVVSVLCLIEHQLGVGYFQLRSVIVGVVFFAIGQCVGGMRLDRLPRLACWAVFAGGVLLTASTFESNHGCAFSLARDCPGPRYGEFAVLMVSGAFGFLPLFALTALAGAASVISVSLLLVRVSWARFLTMIGRRTLDLLIINGVVLVFMQPMLAQRVTDLWPPLVLLPLVLAQVGVALALHPVLDRVLAFAKEVSSAPLSRISR